MATVLTPHYLNQAARRFRSPVKVPKVSIRIAVRPNSCEVQQGSIDGMAELVAGERVGVKGSPEAMRAQRAPLRPAFSPARLWHAVYAGFSGSQMKNILA